MSQELKPLVDRFAALRAEKEEHEVEVKRINGELAELEPKIIEVMDATGIDKVTFDGVGTVYQQGDLYPRVVDNDQLVAWLDANGFGEVAKRAVNAQTLKAFVKDLLKDNKPLPAGVEAYSKVSVRLRKT